jgi:hypothetical protein
MYIPDLPWIVPTFTTNFINALRLDTTLVQKVAFIIEVPKTGTLDKFGFLTESIGGTIADVRFSFQNIDANGLPDNTDDQYRVLAGGSVATGWNESGLITSDGTDGGTKRSVTIGDKLALVLQWDSAQTGVIFLYGYDNWGTGANTTVFPYAVNDTGGGWAKQALTIYPSFGLKYDDGSYEQIPFCYPLAAANTRNFNSSSTPDERGMIVNFATDATVYGGWVALDLNDDVDVVLYDSDGTTALETVSLDKDFQVAASPTWRSFLFSAPVDLAAGED